jgi:phosphatidylserine/phosphatidylglycerophosphate/cardiolipin synthase-like enzyme
MQHYTKSHVAFVMGHNMLDEYWDVERHSYRRYPCHVGRNSDMPRQDFSSRITGPLIKGVYLNFKEAWEKADGGKMPQLNFKDYDEGICGRKDGVFGQILRTRRKKGERDIAKLYRQAIRHATQCVYIENQYFRWPPFADDILAAADVQFCNGRTPEEHGSLYVFVISNTSKDGLEDGTVKTLEMMDKLGRADVMPNVAKTQVDEDLNRNREKLEKAGAAVREQGDRDVHNRELGYNPKDNEAHQANLKRLTDEQERLERRQKELEERKRAREENNPILPTERPGLKIHLCTLVPSDTPPASDAGMQLGDLRAALGKNHKELTEVKNQLSNAFLARNKTTKEKLEKRRVWLEAERARLEAEYARRGSAGYGRLPDGKWQWPEVYVHSKLMIINDTFMTLGSANINSRSMENDSEMNVAHHNPDISEAQRRRLWNIHTGGRTGGGESFADAFKIWGNLIEKNAKLESGGLSPKASLRGFLYTGNVIADND